MSEERDAVRARITGRVQGVAFRDWARNRAGALGLRGWVRNEADGAVTALIVGPKDRVATMVRDLGSGPAAAAVAAVETSPADPADAPAGFEIVA